LSDREPVVRFAAAMASGELRLDGARDGLLRLVDDPDESVRIAARFALHRIGDTTRTHDLEQTARSTEPRTRADTALVLGLLGEPTAKSWLHVLRRDPNAAVRLQANEGLWRLGDEQGLNTLIAGTLSKYPDDQMISLLALAAPRDRRVIEHVRACLTTDYTEVNLVAARAMGMLGSDEGYTIATRALKSTDPRQRLLAALALGAIGRADAQDELAPLLKDADQSVRTAAATALLQLK
jgi:HEAT repeat protein